MLFAVFKCEIAASLILSISCYCNQIRSPFNGNRLFRILSNRHAGNTENLCFFIQDRWDVHEIHSNSNKMEYLHKIIWVFSMGRGSISVFRHVLQLLETSRNEWMIRQFPNNRETEYIPAVMILYPLEKKLELGKVTHCLWMPQSYHVNIFSTSSVSLDGILRTPDHVIYPVFQIKIYCNRLPSAQKPYSFRWLWFISGY